MYGVILYEYHPDGVTDGYDLLYRDNAREKHATLRLRPMLQIFAQFHALDCRRGWVRVKNVENDYFVGENLCRNIGKLSFLNGLL